MNKGNLSALEKAEQAFGLGKYLEAKNLYQQLNRNNNGKYDGSLLACYFEIIKSSLSHNNLAEASKFISESKHFGVLVKNQALLIMFHFKSKTLLAYLQKVSLPINEKSELNAFSLAEIGRAHV